MAINTLFDPKRREEIRKAIDKGESPFKTKTPKAGAQITADVQEPAGSQPPPLPKRQPIQRSKEEIERTTWCFLEAVRHASTKEAETFIDNGVPVDTRDENRATALMIALTRSHTETTEMLISKGADVNAEDEFGSTPLKCAVLSNGAKMIEILIGKGADINATDCYGRTALRWAAESASVESAKMLIDKGADLMARDNDGLTALKFALKEGKTEIAGMLKSHMKPWWKIW